MKPSEIVVGKRYRNSLYPNLVYLGIGLRKLETVSEIVEGTKHLILIEGNDYVGYIAQEGDNALEGFWDNFYIEQ